MDIVIQLIVAFTGSMGFCLLFQVRKERLFLASLGGFISWGVYLLLGTVATQDVPRYFFAAVVVSIYAEILARIVKCPATLYLIGGSIPLIPGGSLYRSMSYFMNQDFAAFSGQALYTVLLAMAIAVGLLFPMSVFQVIQRSRKLWTEWRLQEKTSNI